MNKASKRSSRCRMGSRIKRYVKSGPCIYYRLHPKAQVEMECSNRPKRRAEAARARKAARYANQS